MSGHNKWSKVKRIKGPLDAKRGKLFTKLAKEIIVAARVGGGNPDSNARLRNAILLAKQASMPKENIDRAIARGSGEMADGTQMEEIVYEGFAPGGVAVLVETTSDNPTRTVAELRSLFKAKGGNLGEEGSVSYLFTHYGHLVFDKKRYPEDILMELALEAGAQDIHDIDDGIEVLTDVTTVYQVRDFFAAKGIEASSVGLVFVPKTTVPVEDKATGLKLLNFLHAIEEDEDVQAVHANFDMASDMLHELAAAGS